MSKFRGFSFRGEEMWDLWKRGEEGDLKNF
jgi:hypothetical protein